MTIRMTIGCAAWWVMGTIGFPFPLLASADTRQAVPPAASPSAAVEEVDASQVTIRNQLCYKDGKLFTGKLKKLRKGGGVKEMVDIQAGWMVHKVEYYNGVKVVETFLEQRLPTRILWWDFEGRPLGDLACRKGKPWEGTRAEFGMYLLKEIVYRQGEITRSRSFHANGGKMDEFILNEAGTGGTKHTWDDAGTLLGTLLIKKGQAWEGSLVSVTGGRVVVSRYDYRGGVLTYSIQNHLNGKKARELQYDEHGKPKHEIRWDKQGIVEYDGSPKPH